MQSKATDAIAGCELSLFPACWSGLPGHIEVYYQKQEKAYYRCAHISAPSSIHRLFRQHTVATTRLSLRFMRCVYRCLRLFLLSLPLFRTSFAHYHTFFTLAARLSNIVTNSFLRFARISTSSKFMCESRRLFSRLLFYHTWASIIIQLLQDCAAIASRLRI